jgi:hypothetical protein
MKLLLFSPFIGGKDAMLASPFRQGKAIAIHMIRSNRKEKNRSD